MNTSNHKAKDLSRRNKSEELKVYDINDWCGKFTEEHFNELLSLSGSHVNSKTSLAAKEFLVGGKGAYVIHKERNLSYSVVNRAVWSLVKRHISSIKYGKSYEGVIPTPSAGLSDDARDEKPSIIEANA